MLYGDQMMLLFSLMFPVFAQGFGDAFEEQEDDSKGSQETEQADLELLLQLETCKETPDTKACQQFFKDYGAYLGVDLEQYTQPTEEQQTLDSVDNKEAEKNEVQQETFAKPEPDTLTPTVTEATDSTSKKGEDFQQGLGLSVGRTTFQTFILNQTGVSFQKNIGNLLLRTTVSVLTTTHTFEVLDQNGDFTGIASTSQIMIPSIEEAVLLSFDLGQTFTPYAGAGFEGWVSYAGPQSGVSTAFEGIVGIDLELQSLSAWAAFVTAELNAGIMSGEEFVRVPTASGEYLKEQGVFWSFGIHPTIVF